MNIDRIRNLIQIEKNKYLLQYDNIDTFLENFDMSKCDNSSARSIIFYKSLFSTAIFFGTAFTLISTFTYFKNDILILLQISLYSIVTLIAGSGNYSLLSMIFDKRYAKKLYSQAQSEEERLNVLEISFNSAFNDRQISSEIFNELKVQFSKEEYIELRTQHPDDISYRNLKIFLNEKETIQKLTDEQKNIVLTPEQIKAYSPQNIEA